MNVMMLLAMSARGFRERVAFVKGKELLTRQQFFDAAARTAMRLRESD
jgi:hypothetical protein